MLCESVIDDLVINFYFDLLIQTLGFEKLLTEFNERNELAVDIAQVKALAVQWMSGRTYSEISRDVQISVEQVMSFLCRVFGYQTQNLLKVINSSIHRSLLEPDGAMGFGMESFSECLQYGLNSRLQLEILEAGLSDRNLIIRLAYWFEARGLQFANRNQLRAQIGQNANEIQQYVAAHLPQLIVDEFINFAGVLQNYENIL